LAGKNYVDTPGYAPGTGETTYLLRIISLDFHYQFTIASASRSCD